MAKIKDMLLLSLKGGDRGNKKNLGGDMKR